MTNSLSVYWRFWRQAASNSLQETFVNRATNVLFFLGKCVRLLFSLLFILAIKQNLHFFGAYTTNQLLLFFLTYQIISVVTQAVFRGVYSFAYSIRRGEFDFTLLKPINPLFQALMGSPDANDVIFLLPLFGAMGFLIHQSQLSFDLVNILFYVLLLANGLLIATALHVAILAFGILTMDVDGLTWLYRDFLTLGQLPIDAYRQPIRALLNFVVPIGIMITVPTRMLLGLSSPVVLVSATVVGTTAFLISLKLWKIALKKYSSASS